MIEALLIKFLNDNLSIPAYAEEPEKPPKRYVIVENQGTSGKYIFSSLIAFQVYGESMLECMELCDEMCEVIERLIELDEISKVELNSKYPFSDTKTHRYRYQAVYDLVHY